MIKFKLERPEPIPDKLISRNKVLMYLSDLQAGTTDQHGCPVADPYTVLDWAISAIEKMEEEDE